MKEYLRFIKWYWQSFDTFQKFWTIGFAFILIGLIMPTPISLVLQAIGMIIFISVLSKIIIWDGIKENWKNYKESKKTLFETIKNSDHRQ